jgi:citrate lyase subunit beta/citryl-CoA lyase
VRALEFGLMDFVSAHQGAIPEAAMRSPGQFEHALVAARKARMVGGGAGQGPRAGAQRDRGPRRRRGAAGSDARRARREFGFLRMWSIHPAQIEPILAAFAPEPAEVERAAEVLLAGAPRLGAGAPRRHAARPRQLPLPLAGAAPRASRRGALPDEIERAFFRPA